jgi:hypothetical protein
MAERRFGKGAWAGDLGLECVDGDRLLDNSELKLANAAYELGKQEQREEVDRLAAKVLDDMDTEVVRFGKDGVSIGAMHGPYDEDWFEAVATGDTFTEALEAAANLESATGE